MEYHDRVLAIAKSIRKNTGFANDTAATLAIRVFADGKVPAGTRVYKVGEVRDLVLAGLAPEPKRPAIVERGELSRRASVSYEWVVESIDADGDPYDLDHRDKLEEFPAPMQATNLGDTWSLALIRWGVDGDREYAYAKNGALPTTFGAPDHGYAIPVRFRTELEKFVSKAA